MLPKLLLLCPVFPSSTFNLSGQKESAHGVTVFKVCAWVCCVIVLLMKQSFHRENLNMPFVLI